MHNAKHMLQHGPKHVHQFGNFYFSLLIILFAASLSLNLVSCSKARKPIGDRAPIVGFSLDSLVVERWRRDVDSFTKAAHDLGAEVVLRVANQDANTQISQVKELLNQGIDALVIIPNDAEKLTEVCREAKRRGVPVMS
jgi:D-xylose transport system substrate-binding protein